MPPHSSKTRWRPHPVLPFASDSATELAGSRLTLLRTRPMSPHASSRRTLLKQLGLVGAGLSIADLPGWVLPALAQGETPCRSPTSLTTCAGKFRPIGARSTSGPSTARSRRRTSSRPRSTTATPTWIPATYKLKVTGLVNQPKAFSLDDLKRMGGKELVAGFECSGNRGPLNGLCGNAKWTGVPLKTVLDAAGVKARAREFVFFGADHGQEEIEWRTQKFTLEQNFGRSLPREKALSARAVPGLCAERRAAHQASGRSAAPDRAGLVRRRAT